MLQGDQQPHQIDREGQCNWYSTRKGFTNRGYTNKYSWRIDAIQRRIDKFDPRRDRDYARIQITNLDQDGDEPEQPEDAGHGEARPVGVWKRTAPRPEGEDHTTADADSEVMSVTDSQDDDEVRDIVLDESFEQSVLRKAQTELLHDGYPLRSAPQELQGDKGR